MREEQQTMKARYQQVAETNNTATILLLNRAYEDDSNEWNRRKSAADAYVHALQEIRDGHHKLAENANHLSAKELTLALEPYTDTLGQLIPTLQRGL